jgi:hypothetical protein
MKKNIQNFNSRKDALLGQALAALDGQLQTIELLLDHPDLRLQVFGEAGSGGEWPQAKERLQKTTLWIRLSALYDYAVDGVADPEDDSSYIVTDAADALNFLQSAHGEAADGATWMDLVHMGDGRVALDEGMAVQVEKLALLGGVDLRTVRNAMSSGSLDSFKQEGLTYIENGSARAWLMARRGFKPTVLVEGSSDLKQVATPVAFANFFFERRNEARHLRKDFAGHEPSFDGYPGLDADAIGKVEAGTFDMPLYVVNSLADYYGLDRGEMLNCVMRVFFPTELSSLRRFLDAQSE